ncbi:MAG: alpha/beta hydrolase [Balneolaceae bacterium]|nr:alpha/beta hydrolase [Balneolaceae bacterium]
MSDKKYQVIAYHGWGFDPSIWQPLQEKMTPSAHFQAADRGYFSGSMLPSWDESLNSEKLLLVHSYGLHWCDSEVLQKADHLVIISGFLKFHPESGKEYKRSKFALRKMQSQFVDSPRKVLQKFYERVFYPQEPELDLPKNLQHDLLLSDLGDLDHDNRQNADIFDTNSITIIHGSEDKIVNNELARYMFSKLRLRSQYFEIKKAGHGVPYTHSSKIFEILNSLLKFN